MSKELFSLPGVLPAIPPLGLKFPLGTKIVIENGMILSQLVFSLTVTPLWQRDQKAEHSYCRRSSNGVLNFC